MTIGLSSRFINKFILLVIFLFCSLLVLIFLISTVQQKCQVKVGLNKYENRCVTYRGNKLDKIVYLTFDDGPDPIYTPKILDILEEQDVKATFFLIGSKVEKYPEIVQQISESGHDVGSHSYAHWEYNGLGADKIMQDVHLAQSAIFKATGKYPGLFRPPYGRVNNIISSIAKSERLSIILWSLDPKDFRSNTKAEKIIHTIDSKVSNGKIVLLHSTSSETAVALPDIIDNLKKRGFQIKTISQLL